MFSSLLFSVSKQTNHHKAHPTVAGFDPIVCCSLPWQLIFKSKLVLGLADVCQILVLRICDHTSLIFKEVTQIICIILNTCKIKWPPPSGVKIADKPIYKNAKASFNILNYKITLDPVF